MRTQTIDNPAISPYRQPFDPAEARPGKEKLLRKLDSILDRFDDLRCEFKTLGIEGCLEYDLNVVSMDQLQDALEDMFKRMEVR